MSYLELTNIKKSYILNKTEEFKVLKGISTGFEKGEMVSILGESGGGKSTLLNIIGGLDKNYSGSVVLNGNNTKDFNEKQWDEYRRKTIGFIFQSFNLINYLSILDNVMIGLDMTNLSNKEKVHRAKDLLSKVGLSEHLNKKPNQLSGGQKQRVAIARALASEPEIIIADEPTGALDSTNTKEILKILSDIAKEGKLVIVVTHSYDVAKAGTRIVHIQDGQIDSDKELKSPYKFSQKEQHIQSRKMPVMAVYRDAFKHLFHNFWRNFLIMLGTSIGLFAVLVFTGLGNGVNLFIEDQVNSLVNPNSVTVMKNPVGKKLTANEYAAFVQESLGSPTAMLMDADSVDKLKDLKNQNKIEPGYQVTSFNISYNGKEANTRSATLQTWTKGYSDQTIKNGTKPKKGGIVISSQMASALNDNKDAKEMIGQIIELSFSYPGPSNRPLQVADQLRVDGITGAGQTGGEIVSTNFTTLRDSLDKAGADTRPMFISVNATDSKKVEKLAKDIANLKTDGKNLFYPITVGSVLDTVNQYVDVAAQTLAAIAGISLLVSALMIIVTMFMSVSSRTREIGVLRAMGAGRKDISRLFTFESLLIGIFSAILAVVFAYTIGMGLNFVLYKIVKFNLVAIEPINILVVFVIALIIAWIAALTPARRAAKLDPIKALSAD